jgi:cell division protease FtsH
MGPLTFGKKEEQIFLGREIAQHQDYSEDTAIRIDQEIKRIVTDQFARSRALLQNNREILQKIADELLVREVLDADQVKDLVAGKALELPAPAASGMHPPLEDTRRQTRPTPIVPPMPKPLPQE